MTVCKLSRAEFYDQTTGFETDRSENYQACNLTRAEAEKELKPELLDGHPELSPLERLCFEEVWEQMSGGGRPVYWQSLEALKNSLTTSYQRLDRHNATPQYVEIRFAENIFQKNWYLSPADEKRIRNEMIEQIRKAFQFDGEGSLSGLMIDDKPPPHGEPATISWIGDGDLFQKLVQEPSAVRTGFLVEGALQIGSVDIHAEEIRRLRQKQGMPDEPIEAVLEKEYASRKRLISGDGMPVGQAFPKSIDFYLSPFASEFGNATPDDECFITVSKLLPEYATKKLYKEALAQLVEKISKTVVHELGHTFGIVHNTDGHSVMSQGAPTFEFSEDEKNYLRQIFERGLKPPGPSNFMPPN